MESVEWVFGVLVEILRQRPDYFALPTTRYSINTLQRPQNNRRRPC
jgi:hypothetical protein